MLVQRSPSVASTTDGHYYLRIGDSCRPVVGDEVLRLADERPGWAWEAMDGGVSTRDLDSGKLSAFVAAIQASDRVKTSVKEKSPDELLRHYGLSTGGLSTGGLSTGGQSTGESLTNLGVLLLGDASHRRRLGTAPLVQAIKYDERGSKINKWVWDDHALSPVELLDAIWAEVPDFRESYEIPEGLLRRRVPAYDEKVVRELLVNALVHRPYTQRGDIYLNLYPDRLEAINPGRLPLGVTPANILHASRRRNDAIARVFHDLGLMEREGSGFDLMYDRLLSQGRPAPASEEGTDWVKVTIQRHIVKPEVMRLVSAADARFQLTQRERITLGALSLSEGMTARELADLLELERTEDLKTWLGRLQATGLVSQSGRTKGTRYFVEPDLLRSADLDLTTSLTRIEPHRLRALVEEDLSRYPGSSSGEINKRVGPEINYKTLKRALDALCEAGKVRFEGDGRGRKYWLSD